MNLTAIRCVPAANRWNRIRFLSGANAGATLVEVLVAIFIMGVGLLAVLTLFPLGLLTLRSAIAEDRAATSSEKLSTAILEYQLSYGFLPTALPQLTPFLGDTRYEDAEDAGYKFHLTPDGSICSKPAAPGKTGVRHFCKPLYGPLQDVTTPEIFFEASEIQRKMRENLLANSAQASAALLLEDSSGWAPRLVRPYIASQSVQEEFNRIDANHDGQVSFVELLGRAPKDPVLAMYRASMIDELELGAGDEDIRSLPGATLSSFTGNPGIVFTFDTLRVLVKRYAETQAVAGQLTEILNAAEDAARRGDLRGKIKLLEGFVKQVRAQEGITLTSEEAGVLVVLAPAL